LAGLMAKADEDKEEKVPLDKVPKAVLDAVKAKFKGAEIVSAQTEKENGKLAYEINIKAKGNKIDVTVTPEGKIISIEKTIAEKDLPQQVSRALRRKYPQATIKTVEEIQHGEKTSYEVLLVTRDKKTIEIVFDPQGKILEEAKKDKKEEKKD
jgi:uncharacterized membrane protein YkoI